jgi:predicted PurR-regulated permease PerM
MPRWLPRAIALFWLGFIVTLIGRWLFSRIHILLLLVVVSLFLSLAIEPGVNYLARRGWRRGLATGLFLFGALLIGLLFAGAIGALIGRQVANFIDDLPTRIERVQRFVNQHFRTDLDFGEVIDQIDKGKLATSLADNTISLTGTVLGGVLQVLSILLLTFYMVTDGPRMRRAICGRLRPERQERVLHAWEVAIDKTGGYLYSRALLALLSAVFHTVVFIIFGLDYPLALGIWVGLVSQFLPVIGTYLAGLLPILVALLDDPLRAVWVLIAIVLYQQLENYYFSPRITARTLEIHPAVAFSAAIAGAAVLGPVGAILALPACATVQAFVNEWAPRYDVVGHNLTSFEPHARRKRRLRQPRAADAGDEPAPPDGQASPDEPAPRDEPSPDDQASPDEPAPPDGPSPET